MAALFDTLKLGFSAGLLTIFSLLGNRPVRPRHLHDGL
jgi:hypothetical protein